MSSSRPIVAVRRVLAVKPWLYWLAIAVLAASTAATVLERTDRVDAARAAWGRTTPVLVADQTLEPGDPVRGDVQQLPTAMVPESAITGIDEAGLVARQRVAPGEIVTDADVVATGPLALAPVGWLVVPVVESPASGAAAGDRVQIAADGIVIATDAVVVGDLDDVTLIALPPEDAPGLAAAAAAGEIAVMRVP